MKPNVKTYKRKYDAELKHIKIILSQERRRLPVSLWLDLVKETMDCVLNNPKDFLGDDLPSRELLSRAISSVFEGFLEDQRLIANQTSKGFRIPTTFKSK